MQQTAKYEKTNANINTQKKKKKAPSNSKQIVINSDNGSFVATKVTGSYRNIFSTFVNKSDGLSCGMDNIHKSRTFRIEGLFNSISEISEYQVKDTIRFNCLNCIDLNKFRELEHKTGIIYFSYNINSPSDISIKSAFDYVSEMEPEQIKIDRPINFRVSKKIGNNIVTRIKLFPIFLHYGFILNVIDDENIITYIVMNNPSKGQVGISSTSEINDLVSNTLKVFPYLKIFIDSQIMRVFMEDHIIPDSVKDTDEPVLLKYTYNFEDQTLHAVNEFKYIPINAGDNTEKEKPA